MDTRDLELARRIAAGDASAESELFIRFRPRIQRLVRKRIGMENEDWEDLASESEVAVLLSLRQDKFDAGKGSSLGSYIFGITMNKIFGYFKQQKKKKTINESRLKESETKQLEASPTPSDAGHWIYQEELRNILTSQLSKLKTVHKEVLYLRYYEDLSIREISERLDLPPGAVSRRLYSAKASLRKACQKADIFRSLDMS